MSETYVYLLEGWGLYKIGKSYRVGERIAQLQACCPCPLTLVCLLQNRRSLELHLHLQFRDKRRHGEWFALTEEDVLWFKAHPLAVPTPTGIATFPPRTGIRSGRKRRSPLRPGRAGTARAAMHSNSTWAPTAGPATSCSSSPSTLG